MNLFFECAVFVVGLAFGSFLNVCISRIPRDRSIISPGSHCPGCGHPIRWRHNLPLLGWVVLRGRCADCGTRIPLRYLFVELATASLFVACFVEFGATWLALKLCIFCFLVLGLLFMDAETGLLPREFTYTGIVLGLVLSGIAPFDPAATSLLLRAWSPDLVLRPGALGFLDAVIASLLGATFFYVIWALYYLVRKRHGLGFGDIAMIAMCGAFLGLKLTIFVLFAAPVTASLFALGLLLPARRIRRQHSGTRAEGTSVSRREMFLVGELPFGVFLGLCSLIAIFFGEAAWKWYLQWAGAL